MSDRLFTDCCYGTELQHTAEQPCPREGITPGPWAVRHSRGASGDIAIIAPAGIVAECFSAIRAHDERSSETLANARLIAAAPELLDHAEQDVAELEYYIGNPSAWEFYDDKVSEMLRHVVTRARATIAKARGQ